MLPDLERADRIGEFWSYPESRTESLLGFAGVLRMVLLLGNSDNPTKVNRRVRPERRTE
jgi:hypothetical protein